MMKSMKNNKKNINSKAIPNLLLLAGNPYVDDIYTTHDNNDNITMNTCIVNDSK